MNAILTGTEWMLDHPFVICVPAVVPLAVLPVHARLARRLGWARSPTLAALAWMAPVLAATVVPTGRTAPRPWPRLGLFLEQSFAPRRLSTTLPGLVSDGEDLANIALFVLIGLFFTLACRRPLRVGLWAGLLAPPAIEAWQAFLGYRDAALADALHNGIGAGAGILAAVIAGRLNHRRRQSRGGAAFGEVRHEPHADTGNHQQRERKQRHVGNPVKGRVQHQDGESHNGGQDEEEGSPAVKLADPIHPATLTADA